ncbi:hypothetical protein GCM10010278_71200 [Streptomyces melanogenes]|nr:hypothetical protein GCM10010278_71200 [Streptomyces melanogenes]
MSTWEMGSRLDAQGLRPTNEDRFLKPPLVRPGISCPRLPGTATATGRCRAVRRTLAMMPPGRRPGSVILRGLPRARLPVLWGGKVAAARGREARGRPVAVCPVGVGPLAVLPPSRTTGA